MALERPKLEPDTCTVSEADTTKFAPAPAICEPFVRVTRLPCTRILPPPHPSGLIIFKRDRPLLDVVD